MSADREPLPAAHGGRGERASSVLMVFARAPVAGEVKTRLIPAIGAEGAARLHRSLVERTLGVALAAGSAAVELWCAPDARHPFFEECSARFGVRLQAQCRGDLGARMEHALRRGLSRHDRAVLVGSDIPLIDAAYLHAAVAALDEADAVFGPAEDGGYVLVGLKVPVPGMFRDIEWGGPEVMARTRERMARSGHPYAELGVLWDLDRPGDLARLAT